MARSIRHLTHAQTATISRRGFLVGDIPSVGVAKERAALAGFQRNEHFSFVMKFHSFHTRSVAHGIPIWQSNWEQDFG